jgi:hypothetical protein
MSQIKQNLADVVLRWSKMAAVSKNIYFFKWIEILTIAV